MQPFSNLEIQLIRSSLGSKSDGEIAALLERPIEEIHGMINSITGGCAQERSEKIQRLKEQVVTVQKRKSIRREYLDQKKEKDDKRKQQRAARQNAEEKWRADRDRREIKKVFRTKEVDLSRLISVRIDKKTIVFVKPGTDVEKVKKQYQKQLTKTIVPERTI